MHFACITLEAVAFLNSENPVLKISVLLRQKRGRMIGSVLYYVPMKKVENKKLREPDGGRLDIFNRKRRRNLMITLKFDNPHLIMTTTILLCVHLGTPVIYRFIQAEGIQTVHAEMIIYHHSARESEINSDCKGS